MSKLAELSKLTELLNEKDEELFNFFELSLDLFCIFGRDGYIKRCNDRWMDVTGYSMDTLLSTPYVSFFYPDDVQRTLDALTQLETVDKLNFVHRWVKKMAHYYI